MRFVEDFLKPFVLLALAAAICVLAATGKITLYVHPHNVVYLLAGAMTLLFIGAFQLLAAIEKRQEEADEDAYSLPAVARVPEAEAEHRTCSCHEHHHQHEHEHEHHHEHNHEHHPSPFAACAPFLFVLAMIVFLPTQGLEARPETTRSAENYLTRDVQEEPSSLELLASNDANVLEIKDEEFATLIGAILRNPEAYQGSKLRLKGFASISKHDAPGTVSIARYLIQCCAADALLFTMTCTKDAEFSAPEMGAWYELEGTVELFEKDGKSRPILKVTKATLIPQPDQPYIFP